MNRIFVYDDLLLARIQKLLRINPISETIAETTGKLYMVYRQPIMLNLNDIVINRGHGKVFGAILEFEENQMDTVLYTLDNYKACSVSRVGINSPNDFTYRKVIQASPIIFETLKQLQEHKYQCKQAINCYAYLGNPTNTHIQYIVKTSKRTKISTGIYQIGFKTLLEKRGIKND